MKRKHHCVHCREEIERAACGWRHVLSGMFLCRLTEATPMTKLQQIVYDGMIAPTPFLKMRGDVSKA
jgi:hypothetical protein